MPGTKVTLRLILGAGLVLALIWTAGAAHAHLAAGGDLEASELELDPAGAAFEVNVDARGVVWLSDNGAGEIWALDPVTDRYTVYGGLNAVSDARADGAGNLWWVEQEAGQIGLLAPGATDATLWTVSGAVSLFGTALDRDGRLWVTDFFRPPVYRFDPGTHELCTYLTPGNGASDYVLAHNGHIWLGDWLGDRIHRLDPVAGQFTTWELPANARPEGLAMDAQGYLWWADPDLEQIARLEPALDRLTVYGLPAGGTPEMLTSYRGSVWYTEDRVGTVGMLDPAVAVGTSTTLPRVTSPAIPSCSNLGAGSTTPVTSRTGTAAWASSTYTPTLDAGGWQIYQLPQDAAPWGVAIRAGSLWLADPGRQVLASLSPHDQWKVYLPLVVRR